MKTIIKITILLFTYSVGAQTAFHNFGNVKMHANANIGFHTDLTNDGTLDDDNAGLVGFYSNNETRIVSGNNKAIFYNVEIDTNNDLELRNSLGITNELSFINGKVITPKSDASISLDFIQHDFYAGEDDNRHVDGYTSVFGTEEFVFPIGDDNRLRPMIIPTQNQNSTFKGAYFNEDPNSPTTFAQTFLTNQKQAFIENISQLEFWDLNGANKTTVTLTWDNQSDIDAIANNVEELKVVGWSKTENKWMDLGSSNVSGDLTSGQVTSNEFIPNDYEIITIGAGVPDGELDDVNIIFSPNGDSTNETLVFEGLEQYNKSELEIYNRWGNLVYKTSDYKNDWNGKSSGRATINSNDDLPVGTYFYTLKFGQDKLSKKQKGWVYIQR
ncbi:MULTISPECIES: gliding motility-associated C-terminal domain-containing protein [unclassified Tenacibaculum]|uniref:gliding motility-associated C-terminal domain-containing protein n=1 Tax=unclassified Tenacibaculum TaxID=2635139 RepID=UPI001F3484A8|nr:MULTISPECIES: gliding motility-associated C-terminal domain-containing protein [unclassified Tenacibaculum]MCF2873221.1 gliding motility-associated C-terminal domain-containing protein [Tenacibaculum sp. Cn5-1]MCF2933377.1 gliding motility-associated C-terminal domain-containing protein [Tenacibaculum sp. Cn5-34]MCG7510042.1 gliding motility-associated C-terminal domain-containing protein [Tenacibaculum sp. Cn5-46]